MKLSCPSFINDIPNRIITEKNNNKLIKLNVAYKIVVIN